MIKKSIHKAITGTVTALALVAALNAPVGAAQAALTCGGVAVTIVGTPGDDRIEGTPGNDVIHGLQGKDRIDGGGGDDIICGGRGFDTLIGGQGFDIMYGGQDPDIMYAAGVIDYDDTHGARMFGGDGNDQMFGSNRWDRMQGGDGNDNIWGRRGRDWIRGGAGMDGLHGEGGADDVYGGQANDYMSIDGADIIRGGPSTFFAEALPGDRCVWENGIPKLVRSCEQAVNAEAEPYTPSFSR